jgi:hypothetical protein
MSAGLAHTLLSGAFLAIAALTRLMGRSKTPTELRIARLRLELLQYSRTTRGVPKSPGLTGDGTSQADRSPSYVFSTPGGSCGCR